MFGTIKIRKGFYKELSVLVFPIVIQNLISSAVSSADVVMLGMVGQTQLSAASLAGQVQFILYIIYFGIASGLTILAAQYWGKRDTATVARILGIGLIVSVFVSTVFFLGAFFMPERLMKIWTNQAELIPEGAKYLKTVSFSYLFMGISQVYLAIMKSCERVKLSSVISVLTLGLNIIMNGIFIFGLLGFPEMGITGAAFATSLARGIELILCMADYLRQKIMPVSLAKIFDIKRELVKDFIKYSLPALVNDVMWVLAYSVYSIIMGHIGSDIVAANSIVGVPTNILTTIGFAVSSGSSILLGKELGRNKIEEAKQDASAILFTAFISSLAAGLILIICHPLILYIASGMGDITETALDYLSTMIYISSVYQVGQVINTTIITSLFRAGGDAKFGMICDIVTMWTFAVPVGLIGAFVLELPPMTVYLLMRLDEFVKMIPEFVHYKNGKWLKNITRDIA